MPRFGRGFIGRQDLGRGMLSFESAGRGVEFPEVKSVVPNAGPPGGGTAVTITGERFTGATEVKFGGTNATSVVVVSPTQITCISPAGVTGTTVDVRVTTPVGTTPVATNDRFTYRIETVAAAPANVTPVHVVRERVDPRKLALSITGSSGSTYRWGADERDTSKVPKGIGFGTKIPGGFDTLNVTLNRRPDLQYQDLQMFSPVRLYGGGGWLTAFDGYLSATPSDRSSGYVISPQIVGWAASMKDDNSFQMVYVDRDLTQWHAESAFYKVFLIENNYRPEGSSTAPDTANGLPSILLQISDTNKEGSRPIAVAEYDAGSGNTIASWYAAWTASVANGAAGGWHYEWRSLANDNEAGEVLAIAGTSGSGTFTPAARRRYMRALYYANNFEAGGLTGAGKTYIGRLEQVAVYGPHGLTKQGAEPGGFHGYQILEDVVQRACPRLSAVGIYKDSFIIPQLAFREPTTADAAFAEVNQYYFFDYGVYENRNVFWRPPGTGRTWYLRVKEGVVPTDQGNKIETSFNGVIVQYTDVAGVTQTVGPATSNAPVTSTALEDKSSTNPCNAFGRKRWALLQMTTVTTAAGAVETGRIFLEVNNQRPTAGQVSVTGWAMDSTGREWPVWMMRAGDTVVFMDAANTTPHYILDTQYDHESLTLTASLDAPPNRLEWLMNRLQVVIAPLGMG